jgi:1-acyl-sn-glycerol-3-phosphate acyltransferase
MYLFARLWHGCRRIGPDPLPHTGPAIVFANHPTHADPAFLMASCRRWLCFLQAREYYDVFLLRRLFAWVGCIPVARDGHDVTALRLALRRLQEGAVLAIFPAGHVTAERPNPFGEARAGIALLALHSRAPVFPAHITGTPPSGTVLGDWLWPSRHVHVTFGPAVNLSQFYGQPITRALLHRVTEFLMHHLDEGFSPRGQAA